MRRRETGEIDPLSFGGRYTLIRRLAVGGMAEIYLARQAAMAGFEKEVVIKRLRQELADDPRIVEMFLDEAKIGAQLNHPNIVHVYDVDEHDGIPYIAMEYILGEELNELCRRGIQHGRFLPLEHAVELMRQAAAGMGYFHAKRGTDDTLFANEPLEIVHLDISPSNLLVTQDGFLKVIDFGIARAKGLHARTDVLPGKLSYMSPEQASRKPVDHRSDIFSLGIVLYEITVGRRLFRGAAQEVIGRLTEAQVEPPTFARRNFPPALESIVMRSLEKHPEDRYQSAYDLADDLESFLRDEKLHSGPVRVARYLDMLSIAAGGTRRPELISEAEARQGGDDLDFDSQVFGGFAPSEGAPGPEQAPLWEDVEQNDADIAAALHMELAELRALRTPVPTRPSGMMPVRGDSPLVPGEAGDDDVVATNQVPKIAPFDDDDDEATTTGSPPTAKPNDASSRPTPVPGPIGRPTPVPAPVAPTSASVPAPAPAPIAAPMAAPKPAPAPAPIAAPSAPIAAPMAAAKPAPAPAPIAMPTPFAAPIAAPFATPMVAPQVAHMPTQRPVVSRPQIGAALLERQSASKLPWVLVATLGVAVLSLVAYIVMT